MNLIKSSIEGIGLALVIAAILSWSNFLHLALEIGR